MLYKNVSINLGSSYKRRLTPANVSSELTRGLRTLSKISMTAECRSCGFSFPLSLLSTDPSPEPLFQFAIFFTCLDFIRGKNPKLILLF